MNSLFRSANNLLKNKTSVQILQRSFRMFSTGINLPKVNKTNFYKINQKNFWKKKPENENDKKQENEKIAVKDKKHEKEAKDDKQNKAEDDKQKPPKGFEKFHKNDDDDQKSILI